MSLPLSPLPFRTEILEMLVNICRLYFHTFHSLLGASHHSSETALVKGTTSSPGAQSNGQRLVLISATSDPGNSPHLLKAFASLIVPDTFPDFPSTSPTTPPQPLPLLF